MSLIQILERQATADKDVTGKFYDDPREAQADPDLYKLAPHTISGILRAGAYQLGTNLRRAYEAITDSSKRL